MLYLANSTDQLERSTLASAEATWQHKPKSATEWFCKMFPTQVQIFGSPFLEEQQANAHGGNSSTPVIPNVDFLAACLGGDERLGHRVIYYTEELQFYFYDPRTQMYHVTTAEKLGNLLRALLARCAAEVPGQAHLFNTFHTFRSDHVVKAVVNRCKSMLAADPEFFGIKSPHQRVAGPELHQRLALVFAERLLQPCPGSILTVGQTYALFNNFAKARDLPPIKRSNFKSLMADVIRDAYGLGVRNDLKNPVTEKQQCGWLGLRPAAQV